MWANFTRACQRVQFNLYVDNKRSKQDLSLLGPRLSTSLGKHYVELYEMTYFQLLMAYKNKCQGWDVPLLVEYLSSIYKALGLFPNMT